MTSGILRAILRFMDPARAVELAGGTRGDLIRVFTSRGLRMTKQAVSQWFQAGRIPQDRVAQLRVLRPDWFKGRNGAAVRVPSVQR